MRKELDRRGAMTVLGASLAAMLARPAAAIPTPTPAMTLLPPKTLGDLPPWARISSEVAKKALVVGVGTYQHLRCLPTPSADARLITKALKGLDFAVTPVPNEKTDYQGMLGAIEDFAANVVTSGDLVVVYFSGHGVEIGGVNYLVPADARLVDKRLAGYAYVSLDHLMRRLASARPGFVLIILDACRTNPFAGQASPPPPIPRQPALPPDPDDGVTPPAALPDPAPDPATSAALASPRPPGPQPKAADGLAQVKSLPRDITVAFAAASGEPSLSLRDNIDKPEDGSLYTRALVASCLPGKRVAYILDDIDHQLRDWIGEDVQKPWRNVEVGGEVMFVANTSQRQEELDCWIQAMTSANNNLRFALNGFLDHYPVSLWAKAARDHLDSLTVEPPPVTVAAAPPPSPAPTLQPVEGTLLSGPLASASIISDLTASARATIASGQQRLYANTNRIQNRVVELLSPGSDVRVLGLDVGRQIAQVQVPSGAIGFIKGVGIHPLNLGKTFDLAYAGPEADASLANPLALDVAALSVGPRGRIAIHVGLAGVTDPGRARQVAYLRAMRLAGELGRRRVTSDQLTLTSGTVSDASVDQARLVILQ